MKEPQVRLDDPRQAMEPSPRDPDWERRAEQWREQEWEMGQRLVAAARDLLNRLLRRPKHETSLADITRLLDLASRLSRLSTGLETDKTQVSGQVDVAFRLELETALKKVYGAELSAVSPPALADANPPAGPALPAPNAQPSTLNLRSP